MSLSSLFAKRPFSSRWRRPTAGPCLEALESRSLLAATMLGDLNTATGDSFVTVEPELGSLEEAVRYRTVVIGGTAYFGADDGQHGRELWQSDGTEPGTKMVNDLGPFDPRWLTNVNGTLFFSGYDSASGNELWVVDGTGAGPTPVKDIIPGAGGSNPRDLINVNGKLFFIADDDVGPALWTSDGTAAHTVKLLDLAELLHRGFYGPNNMVAVVGTLYFQGQDEFGVAGLWKSDGTRQGTVLVKNFDSNPPRQLTNVNGTLYFTANDGTSVNKLWTSDGTPEGTHPVLGPGGSAFPSQLTNLNGTLYFTADDGANGQELYRTDGTATTLLDVLPDAAGSNPRSLINVNGALYFVADGPSGTGLYKIDGASASASFVSASSPYAPSTDWQFTLAVGNTLYFTAGDGLWKSDSTTGITVRVKPFAFTPQGGVSPQWLMNLNGSLLFAASTPDLGAELWKSDGTEEHTELVKDINSVTLSSSPRYFTASNGSVFFNANGDLWKTDPTSGTTTLVKHFSQPFHSGPAGLMDVNGTLYFLINRDLWKSDGSPEGTTPVQSPLLGAHTFATGLISLNGKLLLRIEDDYEHLGDPSSSMRAALYASDGTGPDFIPILFLPNRVDVASETAVNGALYVKATDGSWWKTDGTAAHTVQVPSLGGQLTGLNGAVYFVAPGAGGGQELRM